MKRHHWYYLFLFLIFVFGLAAIVLLGSNRSLQMAIVVMLAVFYVILGVLHHTINHTVTARIVIEYIAIATLGISVLLFVLQGV